MTMTAEREHLIRAEQYIAEAKKHIARQTKMIEKLTREGRETDLAAAMLDGWERTLLVFEQHRERIRERLKDAE
jgi:hypothetical protein